MENEIEKIKLDNHNNFAPNNPKINKIFFLQIINLLISLLFIFFLIIVNKSKTNSFIGKLKNINETKTLEKKIIWLKMLTNNDELEYKGVLNCLINNPDNEFCIYHLILPKAVLGKNRILFGEKHDGCYVLLDDLSNIKIAYSFGISSNVIFDKILADKGIDIYMYDHTINSLPYNNSRFHWKKIGLCGKKTKNKKLKNLEELIEENGHSNENNMILKIDIEHWEWESIIDLKEDTLKQFKYIAIEYHFKDEKNFKNENIYYKVLKKISRTHQSFYARCNENRSKKINFGNNRICHILEVSYIIRKDNIFLKDEAIYPIYEFDFKKPVLGKLEMNLNILKLFED